MIFFDVLTHLGAATFVGGKLIGETRTRNMDKKMNFMRDRFVKMWIDPELEAELKAKIEDPEHYNWVWERLEAYKRNRGKCYLCESNLERWKVVGNNRLWFTYKGSIFGGNQTLQANMRHNREHALIMLMQTYGRMTEHYAKQKAMDANYDQLVRWMTRHPADIFLGDTWSCLDEAPLEKMDMPGGWPEDRRPPNDVPGW